MDLMKENIYHVLMSEVAGKETLRNSMYGVKETLECGRIKYYISLAPLFVLPFYCFY